VASIKEQFGEEWFSLLEREFKKPYMKNIQEQLKIDRRKLIIWPKKENVFRALKLTQFSDVKIVMLGQDPYYTRNVADGLAFSTQNTKYTPPTLKNIFTELETDIGFFQVAHNPDLERWAQQGVLLLNASLTVIQGAPVSHGRIGWQYLTKRIVKLLAERENPCGFVLWGRYAQAVANPFMDTERHLIIRSPHPSPRSASRGFFGSKPFSRINKWLELNDKKLIDWTCHEYKTGMVQGENIEGEV